MVNLYALDALARRTQARYEAEARRERWLRTVAPGAGQRWKPLAAVAGRVLILVGLWLQAKAAPAALPHL
jgi:hypothetical protein